MAAASIIVIADAAMSVDNVIALAAIAHGNLWLLAAGVLLSIPLLACGSLIIDVLSRHFPPLIPVGAGLLGWIAGGMAISDPALVDWANAQAPALVLIAPALGALFVLSEAVRGDGGGENRLGAAAVAPAAPSLPPRRLLTNAAPRASSKPAPTRHAPISGAPRARVKREDRIMLVGLVILFLMAAAMIGFVMYMVQSYAVERFS